MLTYKSRFRALLGSRLGVRARASNGLGPKNQQAVNPRAWLRENRGLLLVFVAYLAVVAIFVGIAVARGDSPGGAALVGVFVAPVVMLRIYLRWKR